jgi:hypothetical protein
MVNLQATMLDILILLRFASLEIEIIADYILYADLQKARIHLLHTE